MFHMLSRAVLTLELVVNFE